MKFMPSTIMLLVVLAPSVGAVEDQTVRVKRDDVEMQSAIRQAQATLDEFLALKESRPEGASRFKLR